MLSVVVMVSALLLLFAQEQSWTNAYPFTGADYALAGFPANETFREIRNLPMIDTVG